MAIEAVNPTTGKTIRTYEEASDEAIQNILSACVDAFTSWRAESFTGRAEKMRKAADTLRSQKARFAKLMAEEMGKPLSQGEGEAEKCAWVCEYYADNAERFLSPERIETDATKSTVVFEPLGIVLAVMPWNFPFWQVFRAAAPALMAGNVMVLKHASNVPGCAEGIESIFRETSFPENVFRNVFLSSKRVETLIEDSRVKGVTLTGSTAAGKAVARKAGECLKKTVLELGGSDPYVVLEDANLEETVETCVESRLINAGQSCIAAKRFIVVESVKKRFEDLMQEKMKKQKMGDPLEQETTVGPLARRDLRDDLHQQVQRSVKQGAKLLMGGKIPDKPGAFYPPTVLTDVRKGMAAYEEETFGPVASIISAKDERDAIRIANDSIYGLGAAIFTEDAERGERIASRELQAGACFVNAYVKSDPRLPFGGIKESGYGRELSHFGIREFVNIKSVYVK